MRVHVLSRRSDAPIRASRHAASFHTWRPTGRDSLIDRAAAVARLVGADVCMAVDEAAIRTFAYASSGMPFQIAPIPSGVHFDAAHDKWQLAGVLSAERLPHPVTHLTGSEEAAAAAAYAARTPLLLKPRRASNGVGIVRFDTPDALVRYLARRPAAAGTTIVQEEIPGRDIDCSVLCRDGRVLAHTIQRATSPAPVPFQPSRAVEFVAHDEVLRVVKRLMAALSWSGVAHVDLREHTSTGRLDIIEVNARFWGSLLGSLHAGVNFPQLAALTALGLPLPEIAYRECRYASGAFAARAWLTTAMTGRASGVGPRETPFIHALTDPGPYLVELIDRWRAWATRPAAPGKAAALHEVAKMRDDREQLVAAPAGRV